MQFGLKNAGTTYQDLINKVFKNQVGWNMEVYINDMLVKTIEIDHYIFELKKAFKEQDNTEWSST